MPASRFLKYAARNLYNRRTKTAGKGFAARVSGGIAAASAAVTRALSKRQPAKGRGRKRKRQTQYKRTPKTTQRFKKAVKAVISSEEMRTKAVGTYNKGYGIDVLNDCATANYERWLLGGMRGSGNVAPFTQDALVWTPFSVLKLQDAASVLFNAKPASIDYSLTAGNLLEENTKIEVKYASFNLVLRNISQFEYDYEIWEITNKSNQIDGFTEVMKNLREAQRWVGNSIGITAGFPPMTIGTKNACEVPIGLKPSFVEALSKEYSWKTVKKGQMLGGQEIRYFSSKSNYVVDLAKYADPRFTAGSTSFYAKGDTQIVIRLVPKLSNIYDGTGTYASHITRNYSSVYGVVGEVNECYKLMAPENAPDAYSTDVRGFFVDYAEPGTVTGQQARLTPFATNQGITNPNA